MAKLKLQFDTDTFKVIAVFQENLLSQQDSISIGEVLALNTLRSLWE